MLVSPNVLFGLPIISNVDILEVEILGVDKFI